MHRMSGMVCPLRLTLCSGNQWRFQRSSSLDDGEVSESDKASRGRIQRVVYTTMESSQSELQVCNLDWCIELAEAGSKAMCKMDRPSKLM
jgi:hypothetical protein